MSGMGRLVGGVAAAIFLFGCGGPVPSMTPAPTTPAPHTATPPATGSPRPSPTSTQAPDPLAITPGLPYLTAAYEPILVFDGGIDREGARALLALVPDVLLTVDGRPYDAAPEVEVNCYRLEFCQLVVVGRSHEAELGDTWVFETRTPPAGPLQPVYQDALLFGVPQATISALEEIVRADRDAWEVRLRYKRLMGATWDPRRPRVFVVVYLRPPGSGLVPDAKRAFASVGFDELHITVDAAQRRVLEVREIPFMGGA